MSEFADVWKKSLPTIQSQVNGRGVWAALNAAVPVAQEENTIVIGLSPRDSELAGHLKIPATNRLIEQIVSRVLGTPTRVRIIDGTTVADYEVVKRRDVERRRLQEAELTKMRAQLETRTNWDTIYDQLSRRFAAVSNKSLPQNKARFYAEALGIVAEARKEMASTDDTNERMFARCIERVAQYAEVPSAVVAMHVLERAGEL